MVVPYKKPEARERTQFVEKLYMNGVSRSVIEDLCRERFGITRYVVDHIIFDIRKAWAKEDAQNRPVWKSAAMRRLYGHIMAARAEKDFGAVAQFEKLLSDIQGTKAPIQVQLDLNLPDAVMQILGAMTDEEYAALAEEAVSNHALASKYKQLVTLPDGSTVETPATKEEPEE